VRRFITARLRPRAFVLARTPIPTAWNRRVDGVSGAIERAEDVDRALAGARTVIHLAALVTDWATYKAHDAVTVGGTRNVFAAAAANEARVVLASSVAVYADRIGQGPCREEDPFGTPQSPYGWAKQQQERIAFEYRGLVPCAVVRPGNVYGPGSGPWLHDVLDQLRLRWLPTLIDGGHGNAGLAHVENVVDLLLLAAWRPEAVGEVFNAADELPVTWAQYFGDLARLADLSPPRSVPAWLARLSAGTMSVLWRLLRVNRRPPVTREALVYLAGDNQFSRHKAAHVLGYEPRVGYQAGLATIAHYLASP
jgi:nucleoside-diphosphate-sugar epimerase